MKHSATLLALTLSSGLIADDCCQPCCVPNPRPPICTEAYTPAFDDMQCDWDVFIDAEFLYWYAGERDLFYAVKEETQVKGTAFNFTTGGRTNVFTAAPIEYKYLGTSWDPGFRLGLGTKLCDGWDLSLYWTYYKNNQKNSTSVDNLPTPTGALSRNPFPTTGGFALMNPFLSPTFFNTPFDSISAKWNFRINQIDLEIGRKYFLSECFVMRSYAGLRGAWSTTHLNITSKNSTATTNPSDLIAANPYKDRFHNRNWGVGLLGGVQPSWYFTDEFSLFANLEAALLWGKFKEKSSQDYIGTTLASGVLINAIDYSNSFTANYSGMQPVIDLALGLRWETNWCENRYAFALDAGWEHHIWFNYNKRSINTGDFFYGAVSTNNQQDTALSFFSDSKDVYFGGFVLRARFDF